MNQAHHRQGNQINEQGTQLNNPNVAFVVNHHDLDYEDPFDNSTTGSPSTLAPDEFSDSEEEADHVTADHTTDVAQPDIAIDFASQQLSDLPTPSPRLHNSPPTPAKYILPPFQDTKTAPHYSLYDSTPRPTESAPVASTSSPGINFPDLPTPTHEPIISKMDSRRGVYLPTGRGSAQPSIPQFLTMPTNISTESTDSQGSVRTQVPGSFHQEQYYGQANNGAVPFATPDLDSMSTFSAPAFKGLNPTSMPWAPPGGEQSQFGGSQYGMGSPSVGVATPRHMGYPPANNGYATQLKPTAYNAAQGAYVPQQQKMSDYGISAHGGNGAYNGRGSMGGYQQPQQMGGNMGGYPTSNVYSQGMGAAPYQPSNPYGPSQNGGPPPSPYNAASMSNYNGQYGQGAQMGGYAYQGSGQVDNGYGNATNYAVGGQNQMYQNNQYGSAAGDGYQPQGQPWAGQYQAQAQYPAQNSYVNPSNANRGKSVYNKPYIPAAPYNQSNLATAPVVNNYNQGRHPEQQSYQVQDGGAVQPPLRVSSTSPTVNSSAAQSTSTSSVLGVESAAGMSSPIARLPQEFSSEPRNTRTPILRSRHGQHGVPSTDPSSKSGLVSWLENVSPTPAPRMLSVDTSNVNLSGGDILAQAQKAGAMPFTSGGPRSEADPFAVTRATPMKPAINPFGPSPQQLGPFNGRGMFAKPTVSAALRSLTANGRPGISEALDSDTLPFVEYCRKAREDTWGVIKIKNIPYSVNRPEVLAFLGRNARLINEQDFEPVHIVMERVTSKTLDCYVEFISFNEAVNAVNRFETNRTGGRGGRLGQRHVEVELSSQEQLMHDLFPKAKNVTWHGSRPVIAPRDFNDKYNSGFQGFISKEELVMLVKHVEAPQRSPFSKECPQRPFECLISTLLKYPWYMVDVITIDDRNQLFKVTLHLIELLQERIASEHENINLTTVLLKRVWRAALKCPGFSPAMKDDIVWKCSIDPQVASEAGVPDYAAYWSGLWTIGPKPGVPTDLVLYYAAIIRETVGTQAEMTLAQKAATGHQSPEASLFGELIKLVDLPKNQKEFKDLTLAQCATAEWAAIEQALRRALTPALTAGPGA
ncbi:hypothetical protein VTL71DRAFT_15374 [Oculimacula yallundae]|uniref:RRM domain-containing protein n=1 Tax=Oculimacula yallundae TaxID=86028 RepID=A0ABR4CHP3_9HELO